MNALRGHLAEFGIVAAKGIWEVVDLIGVVLDPDDRRLPPAARETLLELAGPSRSPPSRSRTKMARVAWALLAKGGIRNSYRDRLWETGPAPWSLVGSVAPNPQVRRGSYFPGFLG